MSKTKKNAVQNIEIHGNDVVIVNGLRLNAEIISNLRENLICGREVLESGVLHLMMHAINNPVNEDFLLDVNFPYHFELIMGSLVDLELLNPDFRDK